MAKEYQVTDVSKPAEKRWFAGAMIELEVAKRLEKFIFHMAV